LVRRCGKDKKYLPLRVGPIVFKLTFNYQAVGNLLAGTAFIFTLV